MGVGRRLTYTHRHLHHLLTTYNRTVTEADCYSEEGPADAPARGVRAASHAGVSHGHERSESRPQLREAAETQSNNPALMADCKI